MDTAEHDFRSALQDAINECRKIGYKPNRFAAMILQSNPFDAVRSLLGGRDVSEGFKVLWEKKRLDLTVEAIVLKPEWRGFFVPSELDSARKRLAEVQYKASWDDGNTLPSGNGAEIEKLLLELEASNGEIAAGKRIRARLRMLGHYGGLRLRVPVGPTPPLPIHIAPPIPDAQSLLARIRAVVRLPERNHEDVVKEFLLQLGHDAASIVFQMGRIDVCLLNKNRKAAAVFEVKRTVAAESERVGARRQGMDYANQTGALIVVVTDGDRFEIYDRRKGHDYDTMLCGKFQLTVFEESDVPLLNMLRPESLGTT